MASSTEQQLHQLSTEPHPVLDVSYVRSQIWTPKCAEVVRRRRSAEVPTAQPHPLYSRRPDLLQQRQPRSLSQREAWVREWFERRFDRPKMREPQLANRPKPELPACSPGRVLRRHSQLPAIASAALERKSAAEFQTSTDSGREFNTNNKSEKERETRLTVQSSQSLTSKSVRWSDDEIRSGCSTSRTQMGHEAEGDLAQKLHPSRLVLSRPNGLTLNSINGNTEGFLHLGRNAAVSLIETVTSSSASSESDTDFDQRRESTDENQGQPLVVNDKREVSFASELTFISFVVSENCDADGGNFTSCLNSEADHSHSHLDMGVENDNSQWSINADSGCLDTDAENDTNGLDIDAENDTNRLDIDAENDTSRLDIDAENDTSRLDTDAENDTSRLDIDTESHDTNRLDTDGENDTSHLDTDAENDTRLKLDTPRAKEVEVKKTTDADCKPELIIQSFPLKSTNSGCTEAALNEPVVTQQSPPRKGLNKRRRSSVKAPSLLGPGSSSQENLGFRQKSSTALSAADSGLSRLGDIPISDTGSKSAVLTNNSSAATSVMGSESIRRFQVTSSKPVHAKRRNSHVAAARSQSFARAISQPVTGTRVDNSVGANQESPHISETQNGSTLRFGHRQLNEEDILYEVSEEDLQLREFLEENSHDKSDMAKKEQEIGISDVELEQYTEQQDEAIKAEARIAALPGVSQQVASSAATYEARNSSDHLRQGLAISGLHLQQEHFSQQQQQQPTVILIRRRRRAANSFKQQSPKPSASDSKAEGDSEDAAGSKSNGETIIEVFDVLTPQQLRESPQGQQISVQLTEQYLQPRPVFRKKPNTSLNWFQMNHSGVLPADKYRNAKGGTKTGGGKAAGALTTRFELPFDLRELETLDPKDYIRQYAVISSKRLYLYQKLFQRYRNPSINAIESKDLEKCFSDLLVGGLSRDRMDQLKELCGLSDQSQLDSRLFYAFCAVVERQVTGKSEHGLERDGCRKQRLEAADFTGLQFKLQGVHLSDSMHRLLATL